VTCLFSAGCGEDTVEPEPPEEQTVTNPNKPNGNTFIVQEHTFGDPAEENSMWDIIEDDANGYYFRGTYDTEYGAGRLGQTGNLLWFEKTIYRPTHLYAINASGALSVNGVVVVGDHDSDGDGFNEHGYVSFFGSDGTLTSQLLLGQAADDVWLKSIDHVSDSTFVVVGGTKSAGKSYPYLMTLCLTADGDLVTKDEATIWNLPDISFSNVVVDPTNLDSTMTLYTSGERISGDDPVNITVSRVTSSIDSLPDTAVDWTLDIIAFSGLETRTSAGDNLAYFRGQLYLVGYTEADKGSGNYWFAGLAASVSTAGATEWITVASLSEYGDIFYDMHTADDALYAAGDYSSFYNKPTNRYFGYGLLAKIDWDSGAIISNMSFGDDTYGSGFNTVLIGGSRAYCAGYTNDIAADGGYPCWFAEIDISNPPTSQFAAVDRVTTNGTVKPILPDRRMTPHRSR